MAGTTENFVGISHTLKLPILCEYSESLMAISCLIAEVKYVIVNVYMKPESFECFASKLDHLILFLKGTSSNFKGVFVIRDDFNARVGSTNCIEEEITESSKFFPYEEPWTGQLQNKVDG